MLPGDDPIVRGIIMYYHVKYLHCGPSYLYTILRREFWILKIRSVIREVINNCINCTKQKKKWLNQKMGMLPKERVELVKPFMKIGIDFAGPIKTYLLRGRGQNSQKSYICVFVCMCTKAIHIEVVSNLSTEAFLAAFNRFIARRGMCTDVFTDNGTNFRGAERKLADFNQMLKDNSSLIATRLLREHKVNWHFIPPYAPHFGGLWKACVKSIKTQLERVIGSQILTTEELETLVIQVEGMLNQRPLYRASPDDDDVLTPAHYLVGQQLIPFIQPDITEEYNRLNHWQIVQKMVQLLWKRWYQEYVNTLQQRTKWKFKRKNLMIGDIVLIKEENPLLNQCKMGKITRIHPGEDELVRKVTIKTIDGEVERAVTKLCVLPVPNL